MTSQTTCLMADHTESFMQPTRQDEAVPMTTAQVAQRWWDSLDLRRRAGHVQRLERHVESGFFYLRGDVWE